MPVATVAAGTFVVTVGVVVVVVVVVGVVVGVVVVVVVGYWWCWRRLLQSAGLICQVRTLHIQFHQWTALLSRSPQYCRHSAAS